MFRLTAQRCLSASGAAINHWGKRQTEDLKVTGSIPGLGICWRGVAGGWRSTRQHPRTNKRSATIFNL